MQHLYRWGARLMFRVGEICEAAADRCQAAGLALLARLRLRLGR